MIKLKLIYILSFLLLFSMRVYPCNLDNNVDNAEYVYKTPINSKAIIFHDDIMKCVSTTYNSNKKKYENIIESFIFKEKLLKNKYEDDIIENTKKHHKHNYISKLPKGYTNKRDNNGRPIR